MSVPATCTEWWMPYYFTNVDTTSSKSCFCIVCWQCNCQESKKHRSIKCWSVCWGTVWLHYCAHSVVENGDILINMIIFLQSDIFTSMKNVECIIRANLYLERNNLIKKKIAIFVLRWPQFFSLQCRYAPCRYSGEK